MKYRVKFKCYHYNTGAADNCTYDNYEDFDTLPEAHTFRTRLIEQRTKEMEYDHRKITFDEYEAWKRTFDVYKVEGGYVSFSIWGELPKIVGFEEAREIPLIHIATPKFSEKQLAEEEQLVKKYSFPYQGWDSIEQLEDVIGESEATSLHFGHVEGEEEDVKYDLEITIKRTQRSKKQ